MARHRPARVEVARVPAAAAPARKHARKASPVELDRTIHERVRLAIVSALAGADTLTFNELKDLLGTSDGNLSVHARRLEEAGFVACEKTFVDRVPRTAYRLTGAGRTALDDYLAHMEALIRRVRAG
ncbi:MAG: winged helix-turn-helix domain-containing protein [Lysobacteraceae bacterium]